MKKIVQLCLFICMVSPALAQLNLSEYSGVDAIFIEVQWGNINIQGTSEKSPTAFSLSCLYTGSDKKTTQLSSFSDFFDVTLKNNSLYIIGREPAGFESLDVTLMVPKDILVDAKIIRGGNLFANSLSSGIEANILNGSIKMEGIGNYALVNAANGGIDVAFAWVDKSKPISLVTMNGGVTVTLPKQAKRDVRLISRKNGYIVSQFDLANASQIGNLNIREYAKSPIVQSTQINGGGALLFLSTENGPIQIFKNM